MRILGGAVILLLAGGGNLSALQEQDGVIEELQKQVEELRREVAALKQAAEPAPSAGLEARLDEVIQQSPTEPLLEPMRLNVTAPLLDQVTWSGDFKVRGAWWANFNTPGTEDDKLAFDQEFNLGIGMRLSERVQLSAEFHDARVYGSEFPGTEIFDNDDFTTLALDIADVWGFDVRMGRQKVELGEERQVGDDEWLNTRTLFDGVSAVGEVADGWALYGGVFRLADGDYFSPFEISPGGDGSNAEFYTAYLSTEGDYGEVDFYVLFVDADSGSPVAPVSETRLTTYGARWAHSFDPFFWDVEAATQFGEVGGLDTDDYGFDHWAMSGRAGWNAEDLEFLESVYVGYDYATGGDNTYVQLFPSLHGWFGLTDFVSWTNVIQYVAGVRFEALDGAWDASWRWIDLESDSGGFVGYNSSGAQGSGGDDDFGQEFDLNYKVACTENSDVDAGFAWFFPGDVYQNAYGSTNDVLFAYMMYGIRF